jgi:hypothetical protein
VFAKVHFTLFYTAVLNAMQTVLLAFLSFRISRRLWVDTESLSLNNYVEIREEFDHVNQQLQSLRRNGGRRIWKQPHDSQSTGSQRSPTDALFDFHLFGSITDLRRDVWELIRYPVLKRKYSNLLLQVCVYYFTLCQKCIHWWSDSVFLLPCILSRCDIMKCVFTLSKHTISLPN